MAHQFSPSSSSVESGTSGGYGGCGGGRRGGRPGSSGNAAAYGEECSPGHHHTAGLQLNSRFKDYEAFMTSAATSMTQITSGFIA